MRRDVPNICFRTTRIVSARRELGIELSLAGHTHGGRSNSKLSTIDLARHGSLRISSQVSTTRHFRTAAASAADPSAEKKSFLYVNRGLGTFGMPVRIGVPPEITLLTLRRA